MPIKIKTVSELLTKLQNQEVEPAEVFGDDQYNSTPQMIEWIQQFQQRCQENGWDGEDFEGLFLFLAFDAKG